jgi:hypothetical protein
LSSTVSIASTGRAADSEDTALRAALVNLLATHRLPTTFVLSRLPGGANNRVYQLDAADCRLLLKVYFRHPRDPRDRLAAEAAFLGFAWKQGIRCVPEPLAFDPETGLGLMAFVEGRKLDAAAVGESDIRQAADFLVALNRHRAASDAARLPTASEACFSLADHLSLVEQRLRRIETRPFETADGVQSELRSVWDQVRAWISNRVVLLGLSLDAQLEPLERFISPSDFGYHNALAAADGRLRFLDFEYAGWDDPAKTICDFFCQPSISAPRCYFDTFVNRLRPLLDDSGYVHDRVRLLMPAIQVKWCCIMLNRLLPEGTARREFANAIVPVDLVAIRQKMAQVLDWLEDNR